MGPTRSLQAKPVSKSAEPRSQPLRRRNPHDSQASVLGLQQSAGNRAVNNIIGGPDSPGPRGPGQPLEPALCSEMESRFGEQFGDVRIHTDTQAADSARTINAVAYAIGHDLVFQTGRYAPHTRPGKTLLAHELAHVVQQRRGGPAPPSLEPGNALDQFADQAAAAIVGGTEVVNVQGASAAGIARQTPKGGGTAAAAVEELIEVPTLDELLEDMSKQAVESKIESSILDQLEVGPPAAPGEPAAKGANSPDVQKPTGPAAEQLQKNVDLPPTLAKIAEGTGKQGELKFTLEEILEETHKKLREEEFMDELLESIRKKRIEQGREILKEILEDLEKQKQFSQVIETAVDQAAKKAGLPELAVEMAKKSAAEPALAPAVQDVVKHAAPVGPRTPLDIPKEGIDMPWVGNLPKGKSSELGYLRDPRYYWKEYLKTYPDQLSDENKIRIKNGRSPKVDDTWLEYHRQHTPYKWDRLEHHHLGQGSRAVPLPSKLHDAYTVFHPKAQVVGEPGKPTQPLEPLPASGRTRSEMERHAKEGRLKGVDPQNLPEHKIPRSSALAGVPEQELRPVKPDAGIDPETGVAKKPAAPEPPSKVDTATKTASPPEKPSPVDTAVHSTPEVTPEPKTSSELPPSTAVKEAMEEAPAKSIDEAAEKTLAESLEKRTERELAEIMEEGAAKKVAKATESAFAERAVKAVSSAALENAAEKRVASLTPGIGIAFSAQDIGKGVEDIGHGHFVTGIGTIGVATVDIAADALHVGDLATGAGGTALSLTVQSWTTAMQMGFEQARVEERSRELEAYIKEHGKLPSHKELKAYYGMGDEQILFMEQDLSGYKPVNSLYDVPEDEKDAYVVKVALERGANPPSEKSGRPVILTEHLDLHIRKRIQELETAAETATGDQAEKLRAKRDALATLLPGLEPHIKHEKELKEKEEKKERQRKYQEWKKWDEQRRQAEAAKEEAAKKGAPVKEAAPVSSQGPTLMPSQQAEPSFQPFGPNAPVLKNPQQEFAKNYVSSAGHWSRSLVELGKELVKQTEAGETPDAGNLKRFLSEEASWRKTVTEYITWFTQQGQDDAVTQLNELLGKRGLTLQKIRARLSG